MIAFVHVAKTGGRTIEAMFRSAHGHRHCVAPRLNPVERLDPSQTRFTIPKYGAEELACIQAVMPGMKSLGGHHIALWSNVEEHFDDVQYLLFLREPLRRGASHYQYHLQHDDFTDRYGFRNFTWNQWVEWETHHDHQLKMISPNVDVEEAIGLLRTKRVFVGLMERFDESLVLFRRLFAPGLRISYRRKNTARQNEIAKELLQDPRKVEQIRRMYANEFPLYEYVANELYPTYVREYGSRLGEDVERFVSRERDRVNRVNLLKYHAYRKWIFMPRLRRIRKNAVMA